MSIRSHFCENQFWNNEAFLAASLFMDAWTTHLQFCFDFSKKNACESTCKYRWIFNLSCENLATKRKIIPRNFQDNVWFLEHCYQMKLAAILEKEFWEFEEFLAATSSVNNWRTPPPPRPATDSPSPPLIHHPHPLVQPHLPLIQAPPPPRWFKPPPPSLKWLISSNNKIYFFKASQNCCFKKVEKFQNQTFLAKFSMSQKNLQESCKKQIPLASILHFFSTRIISCKFLQKFFQESSKFCLRQWLGLKRNKWQSYNKCYSL